MKSIYLFLTSLVITVSSFAQQRSTVKWGEDFKLKRQIILVMICATLRTKENNWTDRNYCFGIYNYHRNSRFSNSLLILQILLVIYANIISRKARVCNVLPVIMRNKEFKKKYPACEYPTNRRNKDIDITGVPGSDQIKLAYSQIRIREILQQNLLFK